MSQHAIRCARGCPHYDDRPPVHLRVEPGFGVCRAERPSSRGARYEGLKVFPMWPWLDGAEEWCGSHPEMQAHARRLEREAGVALEAQEAARG